MAETCHPIIQRSALDTDPAVSHVNIPSRTLAQLQRSACVPLNPFTELPALIAQLLGAESVAFCAITKLFGTKQELFAAIVLIEQFLGTLPFVRRWKGSTLSGIDNFKTG